MNEWIQRIHSAEKKVYFLAGKIGRLLRKNAIEPCGSSRVCILYLSIAAIAPERIGEVEAFLLDCNLAKEIESLFLIRDSF